MSQGVYFAAGASFEHLARVLSDVARERQRQFEEWGEQNHLDGTGWDGRPLDGIGRELTGFSMRTAPAGRIAAAARLACQANGTPERPDTWAAILLEEVFEALEQDDPLALRTELIQVAAVAVQWIETLQARIRDEGRTP